MTDTKIPTRQEPISPSQRRWVMVAIVFATVLASLDASFVPIAFPDLIDNLDTSTGTIVWVALGYLIAATGPMLFLARIGERIGYVPLFKLGTTLYGLAMLACALAPDVGTLIALRVLQGLSMAIFLPATFMLTIRVYPDDQRGKAMGVLASANSAGFILGPVFAGWLLDAYDWRAIFWSRTPLALAAIALALTVLPRSLSSSSGRDGKGLDLLGAIYLSACLFGLLYGLNRLPVEDNHLDPWVWVLFLAGFLFLFLFIRHERSTPEPLIDFELYRTSPAFAKASLAFFAMFASFPVYLFLLPLLLLGGLEFRAWDAGLLLAVVAMLTFVVSPWAGRISDRFGAEIPCTLGALLELVGFLALLRVTVDTTIGTLILPMVLFGVGTGLFFSPNNRLMMSSVPPDRAGMASGMIGTVRQAGYAFGFAITASLFTFIQNRFERSWTLQGLEKISRAEADNITGVFEQGGIWSPEMLVFILHVGALLSAVVLLLSVAYSLPRLSFSKARHLATIGGVTAIAVLTVGGLITYGEVRVEANPWREGHLRPAGAPTPPAPFGMATRAAVSVPSWAPPVLESGLEVFVFYCSDCHGFDARGKDQRGVDLTRNEFLRRTVDRELLEYLRQGRQADDPLNRTGNAMPGMQTIPTFSEANYGQIVDFLRNISGT